MPASVRRSASAPARISSNGFERWLISRIDMPTPGSDTRFCCASSSTSNGRIAGPAEKLCTRVVVVVAINSLSNESVESERHGLKIEHVAVAGFDRLADGRGRLAIEVDTRDGRFGALEDDVLGFLDVEVGAAEVLED